MKYICIWLIRFYRKCLSPLKSTPTCRFTPTCSAYALEAFEKRFFLVALWLTARRIVRCNPFCVGGYDPVPAKGKRRKYIPQPMTKYYYPEEYSIVRDDGTNEPLWHRTE